MRLPSITGRFALGFTAALGAYLLATHKPGPPKAAARPPCDPELVRRGESERTLGRIKLAIPVGQGLGGIGLPDQFQATATQLSVCSGSEALAAELADIAQKIRVRQETTG